MNAKTVELHLLQSFPPSCVNRDGNNSPKDCTFGDVRRARISSQCLKRAIRSSNAFLEILSGVPEPAESETKRFLAARSRLWADEIARDNRFRGQEERSALVTLLTGFAGGIDVSGDEDDQGLETENEADPTQAEEEQLKSKVLLHLPWGVDDIAAKHVLGNRELLLKYGETESERQSSKSKKKPKNKFSDSFKKVVKQFSKDVSQMPITADIALFGRMLAKNAALNVDAAAQVGHAISTHKVSMDFDFWTAADDLKLLRSEAEEDVADSGAGMLGTAEFNASIFYRYACVSLPILKANLRDDQLARRTIEAFMAASWEAIPTGKINGHAHFTPPFFALAVVRRKGMPLNLCNAFIKPVKPTKELGLDEASAGALLSHLRAMRTMSPVDDADYFCASSLAEVGPAEGVSKKEGYAALTKGILEKL